MAEGGQYTRMYSWTRQRNIVLIQNPKVKLEQVMTILMGSLRKTDPKNCWELACDPYTTKFQMKG
jgi:hypothetical protein